LTRDLIEEILRSIGLEKISLGNEDDVWHVRGTEEEGSHK